MDVIDFSAARQRRLAAMARTKAGPQARFAAMQEALSQDELTAMGRIVQQHALRLAYRIVAASPVWGKPEEAEPVDAEAASNDAEDVAEEETKESTEE